MNKKAFKNKNNISKTSINVVKSEYDSFKDIAIFTNFTLQKLINRSIYLYIRDSEFKKEIESLTTLLEVSGSAF